MVSSIAQTAWKAVVLTSLIVALAAASVTLVNTTHLFATALLAVLACGGLSWSLYRLIANASHAATLNRPEFRDSGARDDYLQALLDTVSAALIVLDEHGRTELANRAAHRFVGMPVVHLTQISALSRATAAQIGALPPGASEVLRLADGQPALVTAARFRSVNGNSRRLISLQRVTGSLDAVELKAWHDMMRVLTHEMMNSLTPITSLTESLARVLSTPPATAAAMNISHDVRATVETISRRSRGLMEFVERYRQIAELPRPISQNIDAAAFLSRLERLNADRSRAAGVSFFSETEPTGCSFRADPVLLEQALLNLIGNAFDALESEAAPSIAVACRLNDADIQIEVADNGCGVDIVAREQLFVPFFSTKSHGSGIGLNLARNIALSHLGVLTYAANSPKGSIFRITLPRLESDELKSAAANPVTSAVRASD
jgi:two-component system nitrogen regulation sensor histidine kinase NtrY